METLMLNGSWKLESSDGEIRCEASVPGCDYTDLISSGLLKEPYENTNEKDSIWVYEKDWRYSRTFSVSAELLSAKRIELVCEMLDTFAEISINSHTVASTDNMYRTYIFDIAPFLNAGKNTIEILFRSPQPYIDEHKKAEPLPKNCNGIQGSPYVRKSACHFGWDFAPSLPPAGISRDIYIRFFGAARFDDVTVLQAHRDDCVELTVNCTLDSLSDTENLLGEISVNCPDGTVINHKQLAENSKFSFFIKISNPQLWWPNGLGEQPLYKIAVSFGDSSSVFDRRELSVGLRSLRLDTSKDDYGSNFCFYINGVPIFAKGADFIPPDIFRTRVTHEKLYSILLSAKNANMNFLRVWGGGYYESDDFYNICDELGLLVWQDMNFACSAYPLTDKEFVRSSLSEIGDNINRIKNHASLALYCGNNEIESMSMAWKYRRDIINATEDFFYHTVPEEIEKHDNVTPYWACTPSSGIYMKDINADSCGDTHLWHVWHGLRPFEYYRKRFTRFCSEFGLESYPTMPTLRAFIGEQGLRFGSDEITAHQKCDGGDIKMLYYLLDRYREPSDFENLVYLTQLSQSECIRDASEHWHRNMARCHGSLYWQFNDCWCGTSWASLDYLGGYKALHYVARHFNEPVAVSLENNYNTIRLFTINDTRETVSGQIEWKIVTFDGETLAEDKIPVILSPVTSEFTKELHLSKYVNAFSKRHIAFVANLYNENGELISQRRCLFEKENKCDFHSPEITCEVSPCTGGYQLKLKASSYARYVKIEVKNMPLVFSDNFFDLAANEEISVTVKTDLDFNEFENQLSIMSLFDVKPKYSLSHDRATRRKIFMMPLNLANWFARFFDK